MSNQDMGVKSTPDAENVFINLRALFIPNRGVVINKNFYWTDEMYVLDGPQMINVLYDMEEGKVKINGEWVECGQ